MQSPLLALRARKMSRVMRIFLHEYVCVELAVQQGIAESLRAEGGAMLTTLAEDLARVPGVAVATLADSGPGDLRERFQEQARRADWTVVIAPEFNDILLTRCRWAVEAGGQLLGPSPDAVRLTADKLRLGEHLARHGIATPPCRLFVPEETPTHAAFPLVVKPRHGAGSQDTFLLPSPSALEEYKRTATGQTAVETLVQPYVSGRPVSVAFLIGPRQTLPLPPAVQELSADGRFRYLGGELPLPPELAARAVRLAAQAVGAVPDLLGYVGVDLVLGDAANGSADWVIEINPRLTTSYVGLRALAQTNLAEVMVRLAEGAADVAVRWRAGVVRFRADGTVMQCADLASVTP